MSGARNGIPCPLIMGHYGGHNTGDEAMLAGLLKAVGPDLRRHTAVVVKDELIEGQFLNSGVKLVHAGLGPVLGALLKTDNVILGGGTHFHDDYRTWRYLRHLRYMLRFVSISILAKLLGRKVTWLGMGFGPFYRRPTRWVTRLGLKFCDRVSVRDSKSLEEIATWVPANKLDLAFDLAALMICNSNGHFTSRRTGEFCCKTLGVSVTSVSHSISGGPRLDSVIWQRLAGALSRVLGENRNLRVKVLVLRGGGREDDLAVSSQVYRALIAQYPGRADLVPYQPDPNETLRKIAECDAFVGTRYHAGVLAYLAGCRLLLVAYHRKVRDLAKEIGLSGEACIDLSDCVEENLLFDRLKRITTGDETFRARMPVHDAMQRAILNIRTFQQSL